MNDDFINDVTLNCLISPQQLIKLKNKQTINDKISINKEIYREEIIQLFISLLDNKPPETILTDVTDSFDYFLQKSVYYLKLRDDNCVFNEDEYVKVIDIYDNEEGDIDDDYNIDDDNVDGDDDTDDTADNMVYKHSIKICRKNTKQTTSIGVDDMQKLPLNWFSNIRQKYQKNKILSNKKEFVLDI